MVKPMTTTTVNRRIWYLHHALDHPDDNDARLIRVSRREYARRALLGSRPLPAQAHAELDGAVHQEQP